MQRTRALRAALALAFALGTVGALGPVRAAACAPPVPLSFGEPVLVDDQRAGGEPMVVAHPDGHLLYASHAGTTHFYSREATDPDSAAFARNYRGQVHVWWSDDDGSSWTYVDRLPPRSLPAQGFSDPDFAVDAAGQVYVSEINLVNVAMSRSTDGGRSYDLQNFFAMTFTDRQWSEADTKDVVYIVGNVAGGGSFPSDPIGNGGHTLFKSTDGGRTFSTGIPDADGLGDLQVDRSDGTLYELQLEEREGVLSMAAFRRARANDLEPQTHVIARGVDPDGHSFWPSFDLDTAGNLYVTWAESGDGGRPAGIYYAASLDRARTWTAPVRVDRDAKTDIWPWIAAGDPGRVAIAWMEAERALPGNNAEAPGDHGWRIMVAAALEGLGCAASDASGFTVAAATPEPFHRGTICQTGTACQGRLVDRRLGDYFTVDVDGEGRAVVAYPDTASRGGAVSLPGFVRQSGGPELRAPPRVLGEAVTRRRGELPRTGVGGSDLAGLLLLAAAALLGRWSRSPGARGLGRAPHR